MSEEQVKDYRGKKVRFTNVDTSEIGEPLEPEDHAYVGKVGVAESVYEDGSPSHEEGYLVTFDDGTVLQLIATELELV